MHRTRFSFALPLVWLVLIVPAPPLAADEVDDYVNSEIEKQRIPGLSMAVVKDGTIVRAQGYGLANVELDVAARPETVFKIGSVSKQFLAAGILLLMQDGKLDLNDKIANYLKDPPEAWREITIRHLLTHTSGIAREAPGFSPFKVQSDAAVIETAYALPLRFAPGEKFQYCNVGYFILAEIIHKVSNKPWGDFLAERIFAPLEMGATRVTTAADIVPNRAAGYDRVGKKLVNAPQYLAVRPSGALLSTVLDLAKWDAALYSDKLLKQSTRDLMTTPVALNDGTDYPYGFGWSLEPRNGHRRMHHGGSLAGFRSELVRFVDDRLTVIVLTNSDLAAPNPITVKIAGHYLPDLVREAAPAAAK